MSTRLLNVLLLMSLVLAGVRFQAFLREPPRSPTPVDSAVSRPAAEQPPPAGPGTESAVGAQNYDVIVARDLFSPERGVVPSAPTTPGQPPAKSQPPPKLTLYGVVILDGEKFAYLHEGAQEAKPRKVHEGDRFAGGTVVAIRKDAVTLQFGGSEIAVALRTPKEGLAPVPAVQQQRPVTTEVGESQPGPAGIPRRIPSTPRYQPPGSPTVPPAMPPPVRRFPPTRIPPDDSVMDQENLPEDEIGEGDQQLLGEEEVAE